MTETAAERTVTIRPEDLGYILGSAAFALEFCCQPETYAAFAEWLKANPEDRPAIGLETLEVADALLTQWARQGTGQRGGDAAGGGLMLNAADWTEIFRVGADAATNGFGDPSDRLAAALTAMARAADDIASH